MDVTTSVHGQRSESPEPHMSSSPPHLSSPVSPRDETMDEVQPSQDQGCETPTLSPVNVTDSTSEAVHVDDVQRSSAGGEEISGTEEEVSAEEDDGDELFVMEDEEEYEDSKDEESDIEMTDDEVKVHSDDLLSMFMKKHRQDAKNVATSSGFKRKERSTSTAFTPQSAKKKKKASEPTIRVADAKNHTFYDYLCERRWSIYSARTIHSERCVDLNSFKSTGFDLAAEDLGLTLICAFPTYYLPELVREFYCNLRKDTTDDTSPWHHKVYVRGELVIINAEVINNVFKWPDYEMTTIYPEDIAPDFEVIVSTITAGRLSSWPDATNFSTSYLTVKYSLLFRLATFSILPTANSSVITKEMARLVYSLGLQQPLNLGQFVFQNILSHAESKSTSTLLPFPCLITQLLDSAGVSSTADETAIAAPVFRLHGKMVKDKLNDLTSTPSQPTAAHDPSASTPPSHSELSRLHVLRESLLEQLRKTEERIAELEEVTGN